MYQIYSESIYMCIRPCTNYVNTYLFVCVYIFPVVDISFSISLVIHHLVLRCCIWCIVYHMSWHGCKCHVSFPIIYGFSILIMHWKWLFTNWDGHSSYLFLREIESWDTKARTPKVRYNITGVQPPGQSKPGVTFLSCTLPGFRWAKICLGSRAMIFFNIIISGRRI